MTEIEPQILREANRVREARGFRRLEADAVLARAARAYSRLMAEREFFSHHAPVPGMEDLTERVQAVGGVFDALGENIAMHPSLCASAREFVDGWMASPGHRANLLAPDWEVSGVGVFAADSGQVFATQLFGIPLAIALGNVRLEAHPSTWYIVRLDMHIGVGHALGAFVRNRFVTSADADPRGRARLDCEIPADPGCHHVAFGRRRIGSTDGWIGIYDGLAEIHADGSGGWQPAPRPGAALAIHEDVLYRISGAALELTLAGEARRRGIVVVDGERTADLERGRFETVASFRSGTGTHAVDLGLPEEGERYRVVRRFHVDADRGRLRED
jgi:hypothetical protein